MNQSPGLQRKVGWRVYGSFILVFGILCYLSLLSYKNAQVLVFDTQSVDTTSALMHELQGLTSALRDAETANNVYVLLGKERLLDSYRQKVDHLLSQLQKVEGPKSSAEDSELKKLIQAKITDMNLAASERKNHGLNYALQIFLTGRWQSISEEIQKKVEYIQTHHSGVLKVQTIKKRQSIEKTVSSILTVGLVVFILFVFAALIIRQEIVRRLKYELLLEEARGEAIRTSEFKSQFLANMSHEIRTPMNGIMGMATVLLETNLDDKQIKYAGIIKRSCEALLRIINDILDFSKVEAGKLEICPEDFDLKSLLGELEALFSNNTQKKGIGLHFQIDSVIPQMLVGDSGRIRQILNNLMGNAVKFTEKGGVTVISSVTKAVGSIYKLRFEIKDTGIGIPLEHQEKIFGAFAQADSKTGKRFGGTGLGLNISKRLVEVMGGQIGFTSEAGKGSCFWFELDLLSAENQKVPQIKTNLIQTSSLSLVSERVLKVLVAEDDPTNQEVISKYLEKLGFSADIVPNGKEAIEKVTSATYNMVFLDFHMPFYDGLEVLEKIRSLEKNKGLQRTPIFLVTATTSEEVAKRFEGLGGSELIHKPLQFEKFKVVIEKYSNNGTILPFDVHTKGNERKANLLIADDSDVNLDLLKIFLEPKSYDLDCVFDGKAAFDLFKEKRYDLVLMDVQMPIMDGLEAVRLIRVWEKDHAQSYIPILAFTGGVTEKEIKECLDCGCDGYISKPVEKEKLIASIESQLKKRTEPLKLVAGDS